MAKLKQRLPEDVRDVLRALIHQYPDAFIQGAMQVEDIAKAGHLVDFNYNYEQRRIAAYQAYCRRRRIPCRFIAVKTRQRGVSTRESILNWVECWSANNMRCVTVAQLEDTCTSLLDKMRGAYKRLPLWMKWELDHNSDYQIGFADFDSDMWIVSTANMSLIRTVRGKTAHRIHGTECPLWPDFIVTLGELQSFCHAVEGTSIGLEFTGSRRGSECHKFCEKSRKGETPYYLMFLAWQDDPQTDLDRGTWTDAQRHQKLLEIHDYNPELIRRAKKFHLSVGQTAYCYQYLRDVKLGKWEKFLEDMPCTFEDAWQATGELYYDDNQLIAVGDSIKDIAQIRYEINAMQLEIGFKSFADLQEKPDMEDDDEAPKLIVYAVPVPGHSYILSGYSTTGNADESPSTSHIINILTGEMMAEFHGRVRPHQHGIVMNSLGLLYNTAVAAPECKVPAGMTTLAEMTRLKYPRLYIWKNPDDADQKLTNKLGWYNGIKHIHLTLTLLTRVLGYAADGTLPAHRALLRSTGLINEMGTFINNPDTGMPEPQPDAHGTRIASIAIAWYVAQMETQGWSENILDVLRPSQILTTGGIVGSTQTVEQTIAAIRQKLRLDEYV